MRNSLSSVQCWAYVLPEIAVSCLMASIMVLQGIYAKHFGLELSSIAWVLFISRLFDAVSDPLIGYGSDRYAARYGSRKPFVLGGGLLLIVSSWFLLVPPSQVSVSYFLAWFLLFVLSYTLFSIPHMAWAGEIATHSIDKNKLYGLRTFASSVGGLLFLVLPLLPIMDSTSFSPQSLKWTAILGSAFLLPALCLCLVFVPDGGPQRIDRQNMDKQRTDKSSPGIAPDSPRQLIDSLWGNKPFLLMITSTGVLGIGVGSFATLLFFFVDAYLGLGEQFPLIYALAFGGGLLALGPWVGFANRRGKARVWCVSLSVSCVAAISLLCLSPEKSDGLTLLLCLLVFYVGMVATNALAFSWFSEIADYGTWKFGHDRAATCFSLALFTNKSSAALGGAISLGLLSWVGFDAGASSHSEQVILGLRTGISVIPVVTLILAIALIARIPINARQHGIVRRRLERRQARLVYQNA